MLGIDKIEKRLGALEKQSGEMTRKLETHIKCHADKQIVVREVIKEPAKEPCIEYTENMLMVKDLFRKTFELGEILRCMTNKDEHISWNIYKTPDDAHIMITAQSLHKIFTGPNPICCDFLQFTKELSKDLGIELKDDMGMTGTRYYTFTKKF